MNQPRTQITRRPSSPFTLAAGALAVSLLLAACGGGDASGPPDTTAPTVAITDNVDGTATGAVTFTFTFSEDVGTSFTAEDVTVAGGTAGSFTKVGATVYTMVVTPTANATGNIAVSVAPAKFRDLALNDNAASVSVTQAYDTTTAPPPATGGTVLLNFDDLLPISAAGGEGGEGSGLDAAPPAGSGTSGSAYKVLRSGGQVYALAVLETTLPLTSTRKTISARVYSPTAGIPMVIKLEGAGGVNTGDVQANEAVVVGWQTLTWT
ncbi:MAG: Ig-like domain-containing protein, partial [Rubrivivax sp.]|nr:Ig-like domain-containing protein [Rubrivivax sp.]